MLLTRTGVRKQLTRRTKCIDHGGDPFGAVRFLFAHVVHRRMAIMLERRVPNHSRNVLQSRGQSSERFVGHVGFRNLFSQARPLVL